MTISWVYTVKKWEGKMMALCAIIFPSHFLTPTYINPRHPDGKTQKLVFVFSEGSILVIQYEYFEL